MINLLFLVSCTNNLDEASKANNILTLSSVQIIQPKTETKAAINNTIFSSGAKIGLMLRELNDYSPYANDINNVQVAATLTGSKWTISSPLSLLQDGYLSAYYPSSIVPEGRGFTNIPISYPSQVDGYFATGEIQGIDLLYAPKQLVTYANPLANLYFNHVACRVKINLSGAAGKLTCIKLIGISLTGTLRVSTGNLSGTSSSETIVGNCNKMIPSSDTTMLDVMLLAPKSSTASVILTINGIDYTYPLLRDWVAGTTNSYSFVYIDKQVTLSNGTITDWTISSGSSKLVN